MHKMIDVVRFVHIVMDNRTAQEVETGTNGRCCYALKMSHPGQRLCRSGCFCILAKIVQLCKRVFFIALACFQPDADRIKTPAAEKVKSFWG